MSTSEPEINSALAEVLHGMRARWTARAESLGAFTGNFRHPDIIVTEPGVAPVVVETEVLPAQTVEVDALSRLGEGLFNSSTVAAVLAVRIPLRFRDLAQAGLRAALKEAADLEYALYTGANRHEYRRFPVSGWLVGNVNDLAYLIYDAAIPEGEIDAAATQLEKGVSAAAQILGETLSLHPDVAGNVARSLRQEDGEQTRRMAMTIVANALVFQEGLAGWKGIRSVDALRNSLGTLTKTEVLDEWRKILKINYWPIFDVARQIITPLPQTDAAKILDVLSRTAGTLVAAGVTRSHDLSGTVFQRLVADRKFLATFYTRPSAAALLAALALPTDYAWGDPEQVTAFTVADLACGTGTLLSAVYRRVSQLHEHAGGDGDSIHARMMEKALVGADVMPMSVHLTASMLASAHPTKKFDDTRLYTLPYGKQPEQDYAMGSLDLLAEDAQIQPLFRTSRPTRHSGTGQEEVHRNLDIGLGECDLVIMNPPFTRPTNHEGGHGNIPNPAFAAFGADKDEQAQMARLAKSLGKDTCADGNAGIASYFIALADRMVKPSGTVALVLPLTVLQGQSWQKARDLWRKHYRDVTVVTIAGAKSEDKSFSADTGMGEVLVVAHKAGDGKPGERGLSVTLKRRPSTPMEASELARAIRAAGKLRARRLEDGPYGGFPIYVGSEIVGEMLDCPLPEGGEWQVASIADLAVAQCAYQLANGCLWLPGQTQSEAKSLPMTLLNKVSRMGFLDRDINGKDGRGAFDIAEQYADASTYPTLWGHDAERERSLLVEPDSEARVRAGKEQRASQIWATKSHAHHNRDLQFNSQSLAVAFTEQPTLGGRSWPNLVFNDQHREIAFTLWGNSTLGLLCYWWHATKEQSGRGVMPRTQAATLPTLDVQELDDQQLAAAVAIFNDLKHQAMLPFNQAHEDSVRQLLDRRLISEVLRLDASVLEPLALLRAKLCAEPSVHGGKGRGKGRARLQKVLNA